MNHRKTLRQEAIGVLNKLKALCVEQKLSLYCIGTDAFDEGYLCYRIKEKPGFFAKIKMHWDEEV